VISLVVTGATGYIGRHLVPAARARRLNVIAMSRAQPLGDVSWIRYELDERVDVSSIPEKSVVIHLAADTTGGGGATIERETGAARRLIEACATKRLKLILVSSQSAYEGSPSRYGQAKWQVEKLVLDAGGTVARVGLVYGGRAGGLYAALLHIVRRALVLPSLVPSPKVQPIHIDDLVDGLLRMTGRWDLGGKSLNLAAPQPVPFATFLAAIARHRLRRRVLFVPFPARLIVLGIGAVNRLRGGYLDAARLQSLIALPAMQTDADLESLGLRMRPLESGLHPSGRGARRQMLLEGRGILSYLLGGRVPAEFMRRYVRAVETTRDAKPVAVASLLFRWSPILALVDSADLLRRHGCDELHWRLQAATLIAEASPRGARAFLVLDHSAGVMNSITMIAGALLTEVFWRVARLVFAPVLGCVLDRPRARR
jgi:NADH dehydrogenase